MDNKCTPGTVPCARPKKFTETFERYESLETCLKWAFLMKHCVALTPSFKVRILIPLPREKQVPSGACFLLLRRSKDSQNRYYEQSEQQGYWAPIQNLRFCKWVMFLYLCQLEQKPLKFSCFCRFNVLKLP